MADEIVDDWEQHEGDTDMPEYAVGYNKGWDEGIKRIRAEVLAPIKTLVDKQADDEGLWYRAQTSAEGYVQQELRKLHVVIERQLDLTKLDEGSQEKG